MVKPLPSICKDAFRRYRWVADRPAHLPTSLATLVNDLISFFVIRHFYFPNDVAGFSVESDSQDTLDYINAFSKASMSSSLL